MAKFGEIGENVWHFSVSDPISRLSGVMLSISYAVLMDFDRKVKFPFLQISAIADYILRGFRLSRRKPNLVSTSRGKSLYSNYICLF